MRRKQLIGINLLSRFFNVTPRIEFDFVSRYHKITFLLSRDQEAVSNYNRTVSFPFGVSTTVSFFFFSFFSRVTSFSLLFSSLFFFSLRLFSSCFVPRARSHFYLHDEREREYTLEPRDSVRYGRWEGRGGLRGIRE